MKRSRTVFEYRGRQIRKSIEQRNEAGFRQNSSGIVPERYAFGQI